jgi:TPR repeat protein
MKQLTGFSIFVMMSMGGWAEGVPETHDLSETNKVLIAHTHEPILRPDQKYSDELLKKAESSDSTAQRNLGSCYYYGLGVGKDLTKAIELWGKAASQGDIKAQTNLGSLYLKEQKYNKAYVWFKKASDSGDVHAMNNLGSLYNAGLGVQKNETEGFRLHQKAAGQKDPCALYNLAVDYEAGRGTDKNIQLAIKAYAEAASAGSPDAQYDLAIRYFDGSGVPQDNQKALELFTMAADQNHQKAKDMLPVLKTLVKQQSSTNPQQNP